MFSILILYFFHAWGGAPQLGLAMEYLDMEREYWR